MKKRRPDQLLGCTFQSATPLGTSFITNNKIMIRQPLEVCVNCSKAGAETAAVAEALDRLISLVLRINETASQRVRLSELQRYLAGIGGGPFSANDAGQTSSLPDVISRTLNDYLHSTEDHARRAHLGGIGRHD